MKALSNVRLSCRPWGSTALVFILAFAIGPNAPFSQGLAQPPANPGNVFDPIVKLTFTQQDESVASAAASGAIVNYKGSAYLITAYHNIAKASYCQAELLLNNSSGEFITLFGKSRLTPIPEALGNMVYVDVAADLAVFAIKKGKLFRQGGSPAITIAPPGGDGASAPLGATAAAFAIPTQVGNSNLSSLKNAVAYHCTVSRQGPLPELLDATSVLGAPYFFGNRVASFDRNDALYVDPKLRDRIASRCVGEMDFFLIETMSVTSGFSGTAVAISSDGFRNPAASSVVGIVLAGGNDDRATLGRYALALSDKSIASAIEKMNEQKSKWADGEAQRWSDGSGRFIELLDSYPDTVAELPPSIFSRAYTADWVVTISPESRLHERRVDTQDFRRGSRGPDAERVFLPGQVERIKYPSEIRFRICGRGLLDQLMGSFKGCEIHFRKCDFRSNCLNNAILLRAVFEDCRFEDTTFSGAILSGCSFDKDCKFTPRSLDQIKKAWRHGVRYQSSPRLFQSLAQDDLEKWNSFRTVGVPATAQ